MRNLMTRNAVMIAAVISLFGCSAIVEPVALPGVAPDAEGQEEFEINVQALDFAAAKKLNSGSYDRIVSMPGSGSSANAVSERSLRKTSFPPIVGSQPYKLGVGDEVALIQYTDASPSIARLSAGVDVGDNGLPAGVSLPSSSSNIISTTGRVGTDGSIFLIGVGKIEALGREISELRDEVRSILIRNGSAPNFQMEIQRFNSQRAYVTTDGASGRASSVIPITDKGTTLREVIATSGVAFNESALTLIKVQRGGKTYSFRLADLLAENAPKVLIQGDDHFFVQTLKYLPGKVFLLGGVAPQIMPIQPEVRQTLADILFAPAGPLASPSAQRSAVYLLRGRKPVEAHQLDAQSPLSLLVANEVELRPNDIVFVAEQPIITLNRTLANITPLRILLRDIEAGNIP